MSAGLAEIGAWSRRSKFSPGGAICSAGEGIPVLGRNS